MNKFQDRMSLAILAELRRDARMSWQQLGRRVHLSGQAVAERVRQMREAGVIDGFTLREDHVSRHFITMFMAHSQFRAFEAMLAADPDIESADKVSGEGCYHIIYRAETPEQLEAFLNRLLPHGRYRVSSSIRRVALGDSSSQATPSQGRGHPSC